MSTDTLGISVTLGCASADANRLDDVLGQLRREGLEPVVLTGLEREVVGLGDAIDRNRGPAVYVLCQSQTLARRQVIRLSGMFSARRGPLHTLLVIDLEAANRDNVMRSIRGAVGDLTKQGGGSRRSGSQAGHLRDIVGPTHVTVIERNEADAQRRRAAAESGEWKRPATGDRATGSSDTNPPSGDPRLPPPTAAEDLDPGDTLVPPQGPGPVRPPSVHAEANREPPRTTKLQRFAVDEPATPTPGPDASAPDQDELIELPPLTADHNGEEALAAVPVAPSGPHLDGHDPLIDDDPQALSRTLSGWRHQLTNDATRPGTPFPSLDAAMPGPASEAVDTTTERPPNTSPEPRPDTLSGWARGEHQVAEQQPSRARAPAPASPPAGPPGQWPMTWADDNTPAPNKADPTTPADKSKSDGSPAASRKQIATWFLAGMMTLAGGWALISSALGEFAPKPPDPSPRDPRPRAAGPVPGDPVGPVPAPGSEAQLIATALANRELRALDTLLIAPSNGEHRSFFQADDHCRNGSFAHLRGFRLPRSIELGQLASAGFLGDGRYWSSTPGAADFGDGMQVYDSWVKGLMVTQHDAPDVLTVCVRAR